MSWLGRSHLAAAVADVPEGERVTICGWVDRYRCQPFSAHPPLSSLMCHNAYPSLWSRVGPA